MLFGIYFLIFQEENSGNGVIGQDAKILEIASKNNHVQEYILNQGFECEIVAIEGKDIAALKEKSPIYEGLPSKTLYQINYSSAEKGKYVVIVDLDDENVLAFYRIAGIRLG